MTSKFNPLGEKELEAYGLITRVLQGLSETEQHNVLKEVGLRLGREMVPLGAVRSASIAGSIRAAAKDVAKGPSKKTSKAGSDKAYEAWSRDQGSALILARDAIVMDNPPTEKQKAARRAASESVRTAWQLFRMEPGETGPRQA